MDHSNSVNITRTRLARWASNLDMDIALGLRYSGQALYRCQTASLARQTRKQIRNRRAKHVVKLWIVISTNGEILHQEFGSSLNIWRRGKSAGQKRYG
jgi:hypothetical protein